jgi:hypothetical protein
MPDTAGEEDREIKVSVHHHLRLIQEEEYIAVTADVAQKAVPVRILVFTPHLVTDYDIFR